MGLEAAGGAGGAGEVLAREGHPVEDAVARLCSGAHFGRAFHTHEACLLKDGGGAAGGTGPTEQGRLMDSQMGPRSASRLGSLDFTLSEVDWVRPGTWHEPLWVLENISPEEKIVQNGRFYVYLESSSYKSLIYYKCGFTNQYGKQELVIGAGTIG